VQREFNQEMLQKLNSIYPVLGTNVIEATPEHWNDFSLHMKATGASVALSISSNEGHNDLVGVTNEIVTVVAEIQHIMSEYNSMFMEAIFKVWMENDKWKFDFEPTF